MASTGTDRGTGQEEGSSESVEQREKGGGRKESVERKTEERERRWRKEDKANHVTKMAEGRKMNIITLIKRRPFTYILYCT